MSAGETQALRLYRGLYTYEIQLGLYIWTPALYRFSQIHRVRARRQMLRHVWLPRGRRSSTGSTVRTLWSSFNKPTRNRSLSVLLPVWGENTGGDRFHTKAIESSERVRGRPTRSSIIICQRGATIQRPGRCNTSSRVGSQPERAGHTLCLISQGDGVHYPVGHPLLGDGIPFCRPPWQIKSWLRSWSFASCQRASQCSDGTSKAKAGSASSEGSACRLTTWVPEGK